MLRRGVVSVALLACVAAGVAHAGRVRTNWPCSGCVTVVPDHLQRPAALLVVLHGDEGAPAQIAAAFAKPAAAAHMILFAPQCPTALGCRLEGAGGATNSWWGWLQYASTYDDAWLADEVQSIGSSYRVDGSRRYVVGWSGGADYLGWYALRHSNLFAAAALVAGGVPYDRACPKPPLAAYFLDGSADPRYLSGQPAQVRSVLAACGDETSLVVLPNDDHAGTLGAVQSGRYAGTIVHWLARHRRR